VYAYTQHEGTVKAIESACGIDVIRLKQDRNKDPVEDILSQLPTQDAVLYAVLPLDKAVALKGKAPKLRLILLQLDGVVVERLTGKPYDPKAEYPHEVIMQALKAVEIKGGNVKYLCLDELRDQLCGKTVAVFNDAMREALKTLIPMASFVKTCGGEKNCVEINPMGHKPGYRVSFPGTVGKLTSEQMADLIKRGEARIYYVDVEAQEVPLC
jgi:hypothetical protein